MRPTVHLAAAAILAVLVTAPAAAQQAQSDADTREVLAYRLTMPKLRAFGTALAEFQRQREADPAYQALAKKRLELAALVEKEELTDAESRRMVQLEDEIAAAEEAEEADDEDQSLDAMVARINSDPRVVAALRRAGLEPREAVIMQLALIQAALAAELLDSGSIKEIPKDVNAENVRLVQANKAEITALTATVRGEEQE